MTNAATPPAYPSANNIRYALWLKKLAVQLPAYASQYQLTSTKVLEIQCIALDVMDLVMYRISLATAYIRECTSLAVQDVLPIEEMPEDDYTFAQKKAVDELVVYIRQHPAYSATDAHALGLPVPE